jgi:hypothetical protein
MNVTVTAVCEATVTETWTFTLPDDYEMPDEDELDLSDLFDASSDFAVENDVDHERDREITDVRVEAVGR